MIHIYIIFSSVILKFKVVFHIELISLNIFIVEVDQNNVTMPTESGNEACWENLSEAIVLLPLPYHKKAIEIFLSQK